MRIALISDIHGNSTALEAVLNQISAQGVKELICLGDVAATGPQPREVIWRLQDLGCPVVNGNMDAWLLEPELEAQPDLRAQRLQDIDVWCAEQLAPSDSAYLRSFQPNIEYPLPDGKTLLCYHGSPRSFSERILPTTPDDEVEQALGGARHDFMAGGHTHIQMFRRFRDMLLINPGSVGLAIDRVSSKKDARRPSWAEYALLDYDEASLHVELHRVAFNLQAHIQALKDSGMPHADWWAEQWTS